MGGNSIDAIEITPTGKALGAAVIGIDLAKPVTDALIARLTVDLDRRCGIPCIGQCDGSQVYPSTR